MRPARLGRQLAQRAALALGELERDRPAEVAAARALAAEETLAPCRQAVMLAAAEALDDNAVHGLVIGSRARASKERHSIEGA
jgi:hypothetical protein